MKRNDHARRANAITPKQALLTVRAAVEVYITKGMCPGCAILAAADWTGVDPDRVRDVWVDGVVEDATS